MEYGTAGSVQHGVRYGSMLSTFNTSTGCTPAAGHRTTARAVLRTVLEGADYGTEGISTAGSTVRLQAAYTYLVR